MDNKPRSICEEIISAFKTYSVVLFLGEKIDVSLLPRAFKDFPFACVVTSQSENDVSDEFKNKNREVINVYNNKNVLLTKHDGIFDRQNPPFIGLYNANIVDEEDANEEAGDLFRFITGLMNINIFFLSIGYEAGDKFPEQKYRSAIKNLSGAKYLHVYQDAISDKINDILFEKKYSVAQFDFAQAMREYLDEYSESEYDIAARQADNFFTFYSGGKTIAIPQIYNRVAETFKHYGGLLTTQWVDSDIPYGKLDHKIHFQKFVRKAHGMPQWYAYRRNEPYYVQRNFEEPLMFLVEQLLKGRKEYRRDTITPVVLQGDSGSSKSIELGAIAYKIFQKKETPIIFIKRDGIRLKLNTPEFKALDELMDVIEGITDNKSPILLIWDCSAYHDVVNEATQLVRDLKTRGRKDFVLVCSAYRGAVSDNIQKSYTWKNDRLFEVKGFETTDVVFDNICYAISTQREFTNCEFVEFEKLCKRYCEEDFYKAYIKNMKEEKQRDVFFCYYQLYSRRLQEDYQDIVLDIIDNMRLGLTREQILVKKFVHEKMSHIAGRNELYSQLKVLENKSEWLSSLTGSIDGEMKYNLEDFCAGVALFGQFKLHIPAMSAFKLLGTEYGSYKASEAIRTALEDMTFIYFHYKDDIQPVYSFRTALEAELYITEPSNKISANKQVDLMCKIIDDFAQESQKNNYVDENQLQVILQATRMLGANTPYSKYMRGGDRYNEHLEITKKFDCIIDSLEKMRKLPGINDEDGSITLTEATFIREFYGKYDQSNGISTAIDKWQEYPDLYNKETYYLRAEKLVLACELAIQKRDSIHWEGEHDGRRNRLQGSVKHLTVEISRCNTQLQVLKAEYKDYCEQISKEAFDSDFDKKYRELPYIELYDALVKTINIYPYEGYLYNALFELFEQNYEKWDKEEQPVHLAEINRFCEACSDLNVKNTGANGKDELGKHLGKIIDLVDELTIDMIEKKDLPELWMEIFKNGSHRPAILWYACQNELKSCKLDYHSLNEWKKKNDAFFRLSHSQISSCKKIVDFLRNDTNFIDVCRDMGVLLFYIRVYWMYISEGIIDNKEDKKTYVRKEEEWRNLLYLCEKYETLIKKYDNYKISPNVYLLHGLSLCQLGYSEEALKTVNKIKETEFNGLYRMRTPYLLCDSCGNVKEYKGNVSFNESKNKFYITIKDLSKAPLPVNITDPSLRDIKDNQRIGNLIVGFGYRGFSVRKWGGR